MPKAELQRPTGKSRALRIRMDYFKQRSWLDWSRWMLAVLAFIISGAYGLFILWGVSNASHNDSPENSSPLSAWTKMAVSQMNTGAISQSHRHFENDCFQCHSQVFGETIAKDAWKLNAAAALDHFSQACQTCHQVDSHLPPVATGQCAAIEQNCVSCHSEHQGRGRVLAAVNNQACTQCHADLSATCNPTNRATPDLNSHIDAFNQASHSRPPKAGLEPTEYQSGEQRQDSGIGQFRSLTSDRGRIHFDHSQHLNPGQVEENTRGGFRRDMLTKAWQATYQSVEKGGLVQLRCQDCHQLQPTDSAVATSTQREQSNFYAPVQFDRHCAACHQMTFTGQTAETLPLPHASPRAEVAQLLSAKLVGGRLSGQIRVAGDPEQPDEAKAGLVPKAGGAVQLDEVELTLAVERVFVRCQQCHADPQDLVEETILKRKSSAASEPLIPQRWLRYGLFNHGSHEKITNCKFCHDMTNQTGKAPNDHQVVMIKGPESCVPCHRSLDANPTIDLSTDAKQIEWLGMANQPTLAPDNCILCHRFHWHRPSHPVTGGLSALDSDQGVP